MEPITMVRRDECDMVRKDQVLMPPDMVREAKSNARVTDDAGASETRGALNGGLAS
jgi:hypothetical protein